MCAERTGARTKAALPPQVVADQSEVFAFLASGAGHAAGEVVRIDTHGAFVALVGEDSYKVKRAVHFPFMDLSTLEKRRNACEREVSVNRAFAPELYLGVLPITRGKDGGLRLGGGGDVVEWAVHMRRFDETMTFDRIAGRGDLTPDLVAQTAAVIAASHAVAPVRRDTDFPAAMRAVIEENGGSLAQSGPPVDPARARALTDGSIRALEAVAPLLSRRAAAGFVRRCHADLHLRNIVLIDGRPTLFDALEFDEDLATIDVLYDLAFLVMDLFEQGFADAANLLFNRYLVESRDDDLLPGIAALPLFVSVRAAIRAKVVAARLAQVGDPDEQGAADLVGRYLALAETALEPEAPRLVAVGGLSGSGKSTLAAGLAARLGRLPGAVHLRSDVERKLLLGVPELAKLPESAYDAATTAAVYDALYRKADTALSAGQAVIVDGVHQLEAERHAIAGVAERLGVAFDGLWLEAPTQVLVARVGGRRNDASDADARVVAEQAARACGPLDWHRVDATGDPDLVLARASAALGLPTDGNRTGAQGRSSASPRAQ
jgi:aminoglycoside phosphotransferase family enzyme/predicted kinase